MTRSMLCLASAALTSSCSYPIPLVSQVVTDNGGGVFSELRTGMNDATVLGTHFDSDTVVYWNGEPLPTTYKSDIILEVTFNHGETDVAGTAEVNAINGGFFSTTVEVSIANTELHLSSVTPLQIPQSAGDTAVTLTGTGFRPTSQVFLSGVPIPTHFISSTSLTATIYAASLIQAGDYQVAVHEPQCASQQECVQISERFSIAVGASTRRTLSGEVSDVVWDATHSVLLAAFVVAEIGFPTSVSAIDPASGATQATVPVPSNAVLALSTDDSLMYALGLQLLSYEVPTLTFSANFTAASFVSQIAPAPAQPATFAFLSNLERVGVADGANVRAQQGFNDANAAIFWGADASVLYLADEDAGKLHIFAVDANGVAESMVTTPEALANTRRFAFDAATQRIYASNGLTYDARGGDAHAFAGVDNIDDCSFAVDAAVGKIFYACGEPGIFGFGGGSTIRSFDLQTMQLIARLIVPDGGSRIVRWGTDGLAIATTNGLYLYNGPFVH